MPVLADLYAWRSAVIAVYCAIVNCRAAQVISHFNLSAFAAEAFPLAVLGLAVVNSSDAYIAILREEVAVEAFQTVAVTVVILAVVDLGHANILLG